MGRLLYKKWRADVAYRKDVTTRFMQKIEDLLRSKLLEIESSQECGLAPSYAVGMVPTWFSFSNPKRYLFEVPGVGSIPGLGLKFRLTSYRKPQFVVETRGYCVCTYWVTIRVDEIPTEVMLRVISVMTSMDIANIETTSLGKAFRKS